MKKIVTITFTPDGNGRCFHTEALDLRCLGLLQIERVTTIEWNNLALNWEVRDNLGTLLFKHPSRDRCLEWERSHFDH